MENNIIHKESNVIAKPIKLSNLLDWARWTAYDDFSLYSNKNRKVSFYRLWRSIIPVIRRPIFLIGAERSGTTFLGKCLSLLPEISYHYEPIATKASARYVYKRLWTFRKARFFYRLVYRWLMRIHLDGDLRFVEKTPRNCFLVHFLHQAFPDAQFIHIVRDGRDAALSLSKKTWLHASSAKSNKRLDDGYLEGPFARFWVEDQRKEEFETTSDIHRCIWSWRRHTESALEHALTLSPLQYHEVRYENLVHNPLAEADRLLNYLEIKTLVSRKIFHEAIARAHRHSIGGWKRELSLDQLSQINVEAGALLQKLEYL